MGFEKKLYDFEAMPPQNAWNKIAESLNGLQLEDDIKKKLLHLSQNPPEGTWPVIEKNLNTYCEEIISKKLAALKVEPPAGAWNSITKELLTDEFNKKIAAKFSGLEVNPPDETWNRIAAELDASGKVALLSKKYSRTFRFVAAAVIIGLMVWGGIKLFKNPAPVIANQPSAKEETPVISGEKPSQRIESISGNPENNIAAGDETSRNGTAQVIANTEKKKKNLISNRKINKKELAAAAALAENIHASSEEIVGDINNLDRNKKARLSNETNETAPRYLVYLNDEGSLMKVSKKLADLKCIYTKEGEVSQNALAVLNRTACTDLVKSWQEKLANSPTNFSFNPLELADILK